MSKQLSLGLEADPTLSNWLTPAPSQLRSGSRWREVVHQGMHIGFTLTRSRRRTIGFMVGEDGLRIAAPSWVTLGQIDSAVIEKMPWIIDKLQAMQQRRDRLALAEQAWRSGGTIPYLAQPIKLACASREDPIARAGVTFEGDPLDPQAGQTLWLPIPAHSDSTRIREVAQSWLQQQAKTWFGMRLDYFQARTGLKITSWRLSSAAGRWGSCNNVGVIALNWRLIHFSTRAIDYVIAHEMAHLKELNHSQDFWNEVKAIYPDYMQAKESLRHFSPGDLPYPLD